jgi:hypothetical protein
MEHPNAIHHRDAIADATGCRADGRAIDTHVACIRKCLGKHRDCIACAHTRGYGWIGDPVTLVPVIWSQAKPVVNDPLVQYAVVSQQEVAKRLGITRSAVGKIECKALAKIRANPKLKAAWKDLLSCKGRHHYDPYYECWLFAVQDDIQKGPYQQEFDQEQEFDQD